MKIIAHRGASLKFQENSIEGFIYAAKSGAYAVECDLRRTADGQYIIFHDDDLIRMTGSNKKVTDITLREMEEALKKAGYNLTTLNKLITEYTEKTPILIHIKVKGADEKLAVMLKNTGIDFICGVTDLEAAKAFGKVYPKNRILAFMSCKEDYPLYLQSGVGIIRLWEHWLSDISVSEVKSSPESPEVWIMAENETTGMNGSYESLNYFFGLFADGVLIDDVELGLLWLEKQDMNYPDILTKTDGIKINNPTEWEKLRRVDILNLFEENVYGCRPKQCDGTVNFSKDNDYIHPYSQEMECRKITVEVSGYSFPIRLFMPKSLQKPVPVFVYIMHCYQSDKYNIDEAEEMTFLPIKSIINNGFGLAVLKVADIANESNQGAKQGVLAAFGSDKDNGWGEISAWAWGMSKAADYLEALDIVDKYNIYAIGHSRGGKAALWAGATDTRFSLVISNNSGCTGAAISRGKQGETVKDINTTFPNWFCGNYKKYNDMEDAMPFDQHMLLSLIAPRKLYVASATEDLWACPKNELLSCQLASATYELYGKKGLICKGNPIPDIAYHDGLIGYHIRTGEHSLTKLDWDMFMRFTKSLRE